jgi:hypothetical protein
VCRLDHPNTCIITPPSIEFMSVCVLSCSSIACRFKSVFGTTRTATTRAGVTIAKVHHPCGCCSRVAQRRPPPQIVVIRRRCTCRSRRHTILVVVVGQPTSASTKSTPPPSLIERSGSLVPVGVHQVVSDFRLIGERFPSLLFFIYLQSSFAKRYN